MTMPNQTESRFPHAVITEQEHVDRLRRVLIRISNDLNRFWRQGVWFKIPDEHSVLRGLSRADRDLFETAEIEVGKLTGDAATLWTCGTAGCLAGHLVFDTGTVITVKIDSAGHGYVVRTDDGQLRMISDYAAELIGLGSAAELLFDGDNSLLDLWLMAEHLTGGDIVLPADVALNAGIDSLRELDSWRRKISDRLDCW